ncbi:hypothetical protein MSPP1_000220 [Malassezia sp. CBS 17886]|nr:hypothetical protein MSPP1_000220 [Malassezia sp. CBS 17886]
MRYGGAATESGRRGSAEGTSMLQAWTDAEACPAGIQLVVARASELPADMYEQAYALFADNMQGMYERACVWDPAAKHAELGDSSSRYLLAVSGGDVRCAKRQSPRLRTPGAPRLLGFAMWRFDVDPLDNCGAQVAVAYWCVGAVRATHRACSYELQVQSAMHGRGLGSLLLARLERIAARTHMAKVMLTVFLANAPARAFYRKQRYVVDATSPADDATTGGDTARAAGDSIPPVKDIHYAILSKRLPQGACALRERAQNAVHDTC